ncbi:2-amino-4-hydroxy-6-hydroxymethyldihydropteridine pyrophosphokinase [Thermoanaerobacterium thermosaccharolyticum DSM 571]|uniref:2-amino-4-hydroxy-6-hydroxymethyldihydropteridine diphosphokinase n=2 Tax=Thermoanaerobacterium thermosaccharolyticum TaxID=1517 RepID=D9TRD2_THETC|nr:2-amino-4-hydroxy-6-hydroxymethyldihydropteridine diphosphokinase [Thermoanaerobacterium thermosaccharolyticum]ADL67952.1 2-amino-4-hydroxy-6-hydroxymethyldihydropteridine pyrophosphokinase [Thermoanaerobacterium thermosaccharolyticum DSM 571]OXT08295.1 2-amino-4-hydroxy-6-hydroxymethyldihydropteridine diphosphokinase [Thermoanaerobacterium thermosaccharolyticum]
MTDTYMSIGSNVGDREGYLKSALIKLTKNSVIIEKVSPIYETEPVGYKEQGKFLNAVVQTKTELKPHELLKVINTVEKELGRERLIRWGPRTIDIDILLYGDVTINDDDLKIPHERMWERAFVLVPLNDIAPNIVKGGMKLSDIVESLPDKIGVRLYKRDWYKVV